MLRSRKEKQQGMEVVILEQMVPENHLLRKIDRSIDFSFINKLNITFFVTAEAFRQQVSQMEPQVHITEAERCVTMQAI